MSFVKRLKGMFDTGSSDAEISEGDLQFAAAVLLMEISRADDEVSDAERAAAQAAIAESFELSEAEVSDLIDAAEAEVEVQVSLHRHVAAINQHWGQGEKRRLIEMLWQVSFAEGGKHHLEEHLVRRLADLLHVPHREFLRARHRVEGTDFE